MRTHAGPELAHLPGFRRKPEIGIYLLFLSYCENSNILKYHAIQNSPTGLA